MQAVSGLQTSDINNIWQEHRELAEYNRTRLDPKIPREGWQKRLSAEFSHRVLENRVLRFERDLILEQASEAPSEADAFVQWFESLKETGPGQKNNLFAWLAIEADFEQMKWFIAQEVAGEAGFEDLTAYTQVKMPTIPKLEMARNYWDEMGRGHQTGMHGPMLERVAREFNIGKTDLDSIVPESIALGNVMMGMALNREFAYHSVGALGVIELTAPARAKKVYEGLKRLGVSPDGQRYYLLHSALDIKHSEDWNREVLRPLVASHPECVPCLAEGALMRLNAGARCFERYEDHFNLIGSRTSVH